MSSTAGQSPRRMAPGGSDDYGLRRPLLVGVTRLVVGAADLASEAVAAARPPRSRAPAATAPVGDAVLALALELQRRSLAVVAETAGRAGHWAGAATRRLVPARVRAAVDRRIAEWGTRGAAERARARDDVVPSALALVRALTAAVVDQIDLDAVADRLDVDRVAARIDLNALLERIDIDAVLDRVDLDALLGRVDVDTVVDRVDVDGLLNRVDVGSVVDRVDPDAVADRLDVDRLAERIDLDAVLGRVDLDAVVARVDLDALLARVDLDALLARVDLDAVLARIDLVTYTERVLQELDVGRIVRDTGGSITAETLDGFREQNARADRFVQRLTDRLLGRAETAGAAPPVDEPPQEPSGPSGSSQGPGALP
ncbi:hypothetical protein [Streptomyces sp. NPDC086766]|uniref:hypothetical protein n=1 Tax=Streptomyces sp. NPDC086766 TaxID=3365754 RepID=UPI0038250193